MTTRHIQDVLSLIPAFIAQIPARIQEQHFSLRQHFLEKGMIIF